VQHNQVGDRAEIARNTYCELPVIPQCVNLEQDL
jgi:hypothetical protein